MGAVDLATVTLVAPLCRRLAPRLLETSGPRSELSPSEPLLDVRLACPLDSPGLSTTWTGSSRRLECLEPSSMFFSSRNNLKIKDLVYDPEIQCLVLSFNFVCMINFVLGYYFATQQKLASTKS